MGFNSGFKGLIVTTVPFLDNRVWMCKETAIKLRYVLFFISTHTRSAGVTWFAVVLLGMLVNKKSTLYRESNSGISVTAMTLVMINLEALMWFFFAEITTWKEPYKVYMDGLAEHRRLGRARCFELTERISGRRTKTILMPIWALRCVINEDSLSYYYYYYHHHHHHHHYRISRFFVLGFVINKSKLCGLICNLKSFLQLNMFQELQIFAFVCTYSDAG